MSQRLEGFWYCCMTLLKNFGVDVSWLCVKDFVAVLQGLIWSCDRDLCDHVIETHLIMWQRLWWLRDRDTCCSVTMTFLTTRQRFMWLCDRVLCNYVIEIHVIMWQRLTCSCGHDRYIWKRHLLLYDRNWYGYVTKTYATI